VEFHQDETSRGEPRETGIEGRQTGRDEVGIDEMEDPRILRKKLARKGGLARPVGPAMMMQRGGMRGPPAFSPPGM